MNWIELFLVAVAVLLAAAAFRQSSRGSSHQVDSTARDAMLRNEFVLLRDGIDSLPGRIADETAASPLREAVEAVRGSIDRLSESFQALTESSRAQNVALSAALSESVKASISGLSAPLAALLESQSRQLEATTAQTRALEGLANTVRSTADTASSERKDSLAAVLTGLERLTERTGALSEGIRSGAESVASIRSEFATLPIRFAEAAAAHPAPAPELEELAIAVRESGHFRGDVARQVAEAVAQVGRELSEAGAHARVERESATGALESALARLDQVATGVRTALEPLEGALAGHGASLAPMVQALQTAQDRLEEASGTQRANQVEFSASVELFGHAAQELTTGLSAFAREGDKEGAEDPRAAQKALLEALERILKGFSDSLRTLLSESDLRTRETLAELAARLPGGETPA